MEKTTAVLEICNSSIKLVVGHVTNDKASIIYKRIIPTEGLVKNGEIIDPSSLAMALKTIRKIADPESKIKLDLSDVTLVYPALGFEIYETVKSTNVVSPSNSIEQLDIQNAISLIQKERIPNNSVIIDIVPSIFYLDGNRTYGIPPINEKSESISIRAFVHTLPEHIVSDYDRVIEAMETRVKRGCVTIYGTSECVRHDLGDLKQYILLDLGEDIANIAFIANHFPYSSTYVEGGGYELRELVSSRLNIEPAIAQEFIEKYGVNLRGLHFSPKLVDKRKKVYDFTEKELSASIEEYLQSYVKKIQVSLSTILASYSDKIKASPVVVTGGLSKLQGIARYLKTIFPDNQLIFYRPEALGARDPRLTSLVGALYLSTKYRGSLTDQKAKVGKLTRDEQKEQKKK